jgi:hypothetical protein
VCPLFIRVLLLLLVDLVNAVAPCWCRLVVQGTLGMISSGGPRFRASGASEAPGPGTYDSRVDHVPATGAAMPQAPRFSVTAAPRVPGPGQYEAGPTLIKRSFNMVIVEEEERGLRR